MQGSDSKKSTTIPSTPPPTPTEYTLHGMTYIEFPSGAVVNLTLDSMAKGSRVVLNYSQHIKPCP